MCSRAFTPAFAPPLGVYSAEQAAPILHLHPILRWLRHTLMLSLIVLAGEMPANATPEVWIGTDQSGSGQVRRYDLTGNYLGGFNNGFGVNAITLAGSEVWIGTQWSGAGAVRRYDLTGNYLGGFDNGFGVNAITLAGSEVWIGTQWSGAGPVRRYDSQGNLLGSFDHGFEINAMASVPEPTTALLLLTGLLGLAHRKRRRR